MDSDQRELWLERAAIYEYEAGLSREEAELRARVEVMVPRLRRGADARIWPERADSESDAGA